MTGGQDMDLTGWEHHPLDEALEILCHDTAPTVAPDLQPRLDAHWQAAQEKAAGRLFDGLVFTLTATTPPRLEGSFIRYKTLLAQTREPALYSRLGIRALSVCGVLECADGIVFGRRSEHATYQPGMWQLPPAGSVDASARRGSRIDAVSQILSELEEEVGLAARDVTATKPVCLVVHPATRYHDIGIGLRTGLSGAEVLARQKDAAHREYSELRIVARPDVAPFCHENSPQIVPTARILLKYLELMS